MYKPFYKILLKYTNIDKQFILDFFKKFKINGELNFDIEDIKAAKYLGIELKTLRKRLNNEYSKNKYYIKNVDYIKINTDDYNSSKKYMLNYQCFEKLAMNSNSDKSEAIRMYFIKLREFLTENQNIIYQSMNNYESLKKYDGFETIYFFCVDERYSDILKVGRSKYIINRLRNYNVGRIKEVELK